MYSDLSCRACFDLEETQDHILNCEKIHGKVGIVDLSFAKDIDLQKDLTVIRETMRRIDTLEKFLSSS